MISGEAAHLEKYAKQIPDILYQCLRKMVQMNLEDKADGIYEVNGCRLSLESPVTEPEAQRKLEGHRQFIDIAFLLRGEEYMGIQPACYVGENIESHPDRDLYFFKGRNRETRVHLTPGSFVICFPEDLHRPLCAGPEGPVQLKKAVVKVPVNAL